MNEAHRLGRNFGAVGFAQLLSQVLTLLVSLVLARSLGVEEYGLFVFGLAFPSWFLLLVSLGLDSVLTIDVAGDRSRASPYLTALLVVRLPLVLVTLALLWLFVQLTLDDPFARTVTMILGAASVVMTYSGTFRSVFRAFERLEYGALATIVERGVVTAGVLGLLYLGSGLLEVSLMFLLGSAVDLTLLVLLTKRRFVWLTRPVEWATLQTMLRKAIPFALSFVVSTFLYSSGPVLLTLLQDTAATGEFNAAFALTIALLSPLTIYATVALPLFSRLNRERPAQLGPAIQRSQRIFFLLGMPLSLGGWYYATDLIELFYGPDFLAAAQSFEILIFNVAVMTATVGIGPALAGTGHQKLNLYVSGLATGANVGLCLGLIPLWGPTGAATAFLASRILHGLLGMIVLARVVARVDLRETLPGPVLASLVMLGLLFLLAGLPYWGGIPLGATIYFAVLFAIRGLRRDDLALVRQALRGALFRSEESR